MESPRTSIAVSLAPEAARVSTAARGGVCGGGRASGEQDARSGRQWTVRRAAAAAALELGVVRCIRCTLRAASMFLHIIEVAEQGCRA